MTKRFKCTYINQPQGYEQDETFSDEDLAKFGDGEKVRTLEQAEQCYKNMLDWFNDGQNEGEDTRHFISVEEVEEQ